MGRELTQWKPGQSGNPGGRPKGKVSLTRLLEQALEETRCGDRDNPGGRTSAQCIVEAMIIHAVKGNPAYMKEIFDRIEGKVKEPEPPKDIVEQALDEIDREDNGKPAQEAAEKLQE